MTGLIRNDEDLTAFTGLNFEFLKSFEEISNGMLLCFQKFLKTFVVLNCIKIPVEWNNRLSCHFRLYSYHKSCQTIGLLIGVVPCGLITYVSSVYRGQASDKAFFAIWRIRKTGTN